MPVPPPHSLPASAPSMVRTACIVSCVFIAVSVLSVPIPGVNEPHYLSKARSFADPEWCQRDFFLQSADAHAVFFAIVGPVAERLPFPVVLLGGRIVCLLLLGWGWMRLARELQLTATATVVAACGFCLIAMTGNFSGEWVVGGFESKVPAYGFALGAVALWLKAWRTQQTAAYARSGIMAGLAVTWHPVVGLWFCIGISLTELVLLLISGRPAASANVSFGGSLTQVLRQGVTFSIVAFICALPGLFPALKLVLASDVSAELQDRANFIQVFWRLAHHLDPVAFSAANWLHTAVLGAVCLLALLFVWRLHHVSAPHHGKILQHGDAEPVPPSSWRPMVGLLGAAAVTAAVGIAVGWRSVPIQQLVGWQWRATLLKFYPFRFFDALLPMTTALAVAWLIMRLIGTRWQTRFAVAVLSITLVAAYQQRPSAAAGYSKRSLTAWKEACHWLKSQTPADSLIGSPRESFALKLFAERAEYVSFKDCPQDAAGILEWNRRLWQIHDWSKAAYQDEVFDDHDLQTLRQQTGITHLLTRSLGPFESAPVWENNVWRIYETGPGSSTMGRATNVRSQPSAQIP